jgi:hypothetical protein
MTQKHCAIRPQVPAGLGFRQGQALDIVSPKAAMCMAASSETRSAGPNQFASSSIVL